MKVILDCNFCGISIYDIIYYVNGDSKRHDYTVIKDSDRIIGLQYAREIYMLPSQSIAHLIAKVVSCIKITGLNGHVKYDFNECSEITMQMNITSVPKFEIISSKELEALLDELRDEDEDGDEDEDDKLEVETED